MKIYYSLNFSYIFLSALFSSYKKNDIYEYFLYCINKMIMYLIDYLFKIFTFREIKLQNYIQYMHDCFE